MTTYLEELRERYIGVCDGNAEIIGNQLFIYDYKGMPVLVAYI